MQGNKIIVILTDSWLPETRVGERANIKFLCGNRIALYRECGGDYANLYT